MSNDLIRDRLQWLQKEQNRIEESQYFFVKTLTQNVDNTAAVTKAMEEMALADAEAIAEFARQSLSEGE
jgi:hypothetical protein